MVKSDRSNCVALDTWIDLLLNKNKRKSSFVIGFNGLQTNNIEIRPRIPEKPTFFLGNSLENQHRIRNMKDKELVRPLKQ